MKDDERMGGRRGRPGGSADWHPVPPFEPDLSIITDLVRGQTSPPEGTGRIEPVAETVPPPPFAPDHSIITDLVEGQSGPPPDEQE